MPAEARENFVIDSAHEIVFNPVPEGWRWLVRFKDEPGIVLKTRTQPTITGAFDDLNASVRFPDGRYAAPPKLRDRADP